MKTVWEGQCRPQTTRPSRSASNSSKHDGMIDAAHLFHRPQKHETILEGRHRAGPRHLGSVVPRGFAFAPVAMVEGEIVRAGGGVEKGDLADDVGEAPDEQGECARCELSGVGIVKWDLGD